MIKGSVINSGQKKEAWIKNARDVIAVFKGHFSSVFLFFKLLKKNSLYKLKEIKGKTAVLLALVLPKANIVGAFIISPK